MRACDQSETTLVIRLKKTTLYAPLAACFAAMVLFAISRDWVRLATFAVIFLFVGKEVLLDTRTLTLSPGGLAMGKRFFKWGDIEGFTFRERGLFSAKIRSIGFNVVPSHPGEGLGRQINRGLTGFDYEIKAGYEMDPAELYKALTEWRAKAVSPETAAAPSAGGDERTPSRAAGHGSTAGAKRLQYVLAAAAVIGLIGAGGTIVWSKGRSAGMRGPDQIAVLGDSVCIHFGHRLYLLSSEGDLRRSISLADLGIKGHLEDMQILRNGDLLIGDSTGLISRCDMDSMTCAAIPSPGSRAMESPFKFIVDEAGGRMFIVDVGRHKLLSQDLAGGAGAELAGGKTLRYPNAVSLARDGLLYVADTNNHRILSLRAGSAGREPGRSLSMENTPARSGHTWPVALAQGPDDEWWVLNADAMLAHADLVVFDRDWTPKKRMSLPTYSDLIDIAWTGRGLLYTDLDSRTVNLIKPGSDFAMPFGDKAFQAAVNEFRVKKQAYRETQFTALAVAALLVTASIVLIIVALRGKTTKPGQPELPSPPKPPPAPLPGGYVTVQRLDAGEREILRSGMRMNWIIWGAMLFSVGLYIIVAHFLSAELKTDEWKDLPLSMLRNVLYGIAVVEYPVIHFLRKTMLAPESGRRLRAAQPASPSWGSSANAQYTAALIVSLALAESMAIYGFVLFVLGKDTQSLYGLIFLAAFAMIIYRPRMEELESLAVEVKRNWAARSRG